MIVCHLWCCVGVSRAVKYLGCVSLALLSLNLKAADRDYFQPAVYSEVGGWVVNKGSPQEVSSVYASIWRWDQNGFSTKLESVLPSKWKLQRYYHGKLEDGQYTFILGVCQTNPAPIRTGAYWSHPTYDASLPVPCYCQSGTFDYDVQWCDSAPTKPPSSPPKQMGDPNPVEMRPLRVKGIQ